MQERNTSKKSLDSWTYEHKVHHWDLLAWKQYTQCLRYYHKNQARRQKVDNIWTPSKDEYSYGKEVKFNLYY